VSSVNIYMFHHEREPLNSVACYAELLMVTPLTIFCNQVSSVVFFVVVKGKNRPSSPRKETSRPSSPKKEPVTSSRPQSPRKDPKPQTRSVETETVPQSSVEASLQSDIYKLEQLVLLLR